MEGLRIAIVTDSDEVRRAAVVALEGAPNDWKVSIGAPDRSAADVIVCGPDDGIPGAVAFDPAAGADLVTAIRVLVGPASNRVYSVLGVGGGVGTTTIALHLAAAFGRGAAYLDLDVDSGSAARLDLDRSEIKCWTPGIAGEELRRAALPLRPGFRALFAPPNGRAEDGLALVAAVAACFSPLVIDAGRARPDVSGLSTACVLVVPPTAQGLKRAPEALAHIGDTPTAVILNRTGSGGRHSRAAFSRALDRAVAVELPHTPALRDAEDEGRLLVGPWCRFTRRIAAAARALEGV